MNNTGNNNRSEDKNCEVCDKEEKQTSAIESTIVHTTSLISNTTDTYNASRNDDMEEHSQEPHNHIENHTCNTDKETQKVQESLQSNMTNCTEDHRDHTTSIKTTNATTTLSSSSSSSSCAETQEQLPQSQSKIPSHIHFSKNVDDDDVGYKAVLESATNPQVIR